jgi:CRP-like cAMP-binding protein
VRSYGKEEIIHFEGNSCRGIEILLTGRVSVERIDESGDYLTITEFYVDDIIGGNLVFSKNPYYPMTVTAKAATTVVEIHKELLFQLCCEHEAFLLSFLTYISDHALLLGDKIKHYVNRTIRESILAFLHNAHQLQETEVIQLEFSKKELAGRMGVQRTSLSRELQKMREEGLIDYDRYSVTLLDPNAFSMMPPLPVAEARPNKHKKGR